MSVGSFFKNIQNPITRIQVNSAGNDFSYVNVDKAIAYGLELELRKNIFDKELSDYKKSTLTYGLNFSYLKTDADLTDTLRDELTVRFTNTDDELQGASAFLTNTDFTYNFKSDTYNITSALVANYFSDRIYSYGTAGMPTFLRNLV
ncbi:MAG: TonB-dependent receptor [Polaribacter sp.]|nr:TonB-dependent receptor [Polaribacter sp.]